MIDLNDVTSDPSFWLMISIVISLICAGLATSVGQEDDDHSLAKKYRTRKRIG